MAKRSIGTRESRFIKKLVELSGNGTTTVRTEDLKTGLAWSPKSFKATKLNLISQKKIVEQAYGDGRLKLLPAGLTKPAAKKIFLSYSHKDEELKDELRKHLYPITREQGIEVWHDRLITAGADWKREISTGIENCHVFILIVSADFISSEYCYDVELKRALELAAKKKLIVIPVIARECLWKKTPLQAIQAVPKDGKAIASLPDRDAALAHVAEEIGKVLAKGA